MPISNPVCLFAGGGNEEDEREFTYEGGSTLFHFSPHDNGLSGTMENNLVFFANDDAHARDVLRRMFEFVIECCRKQSEYYLGRKHRHDEEFHGRTRATANKFKLYLSEIDTIKIPMAPTNQFYIVGWASNDNVH